jgi:peroxiredoxin
MNHQSPKHQSARMAKSAKVVMVALLLAGSTLFAAPVRAEVKVGQKAPAFGLKPVDKSELVTLEALTSAKGTAGAVLVFLSCKCPYVAQARQPLAELAKQYGAKLAFVGINANQNESADDIKADAALNFPFPMLRDAGSKVADLYAAERTPEVFVVDRTGALRYHGGVADLGPALAELTAGKAVTKPESKAFGCTIKRRP